MGRGPGADVGEAVSSFVHVVSSVSSYVFKVHGDAACFEGGEEFGVAPNKGLVFLWLPCSRGGAERHHGVGEDAGSVAGLGVGVDSLKGYIHSGELSCVVGGCVRSDPHGRGGVCVYGAVVLDEYFFATGGVARPVGLNNGQGWVFVWGEPS